MIKKVECSDCLSKVTEGKTNIIPNSMIKTREINISRGKLSFYKCEVCGRIISILEE